MLGREFLYQRHIILTLIVGTLVELLLHTCNAVGHLLDIGKGLLGLLTHGGVVLQNHDLWQITNGTVAGHAHRTSRGFLHTTENLEHRGLTSTVLTNKGDTILVVDDKGGICKQGFYPEFNF